MRIADLGSRNGVRVNGRPIAEAAIGVGDVVRLGGWVGVVTANPGAFIQIAPGLWGGAALQAALAPLQTAAASDLPIVLEGETGTGKELVTRALHRWSGRSGPLVAVNCAALPEGLAEGELFGYRRGAFTGPIGRAPVSSAGRRGGPCCSTRSPTCRSPCRQAVARARGARGAAARRDSPGADRRACGGRRPAALIEAVRAGRFRADLLARLDGLAVRLPPLRKRREDVLPLFSSSARRGGAGTRPLDGERLRGAALHARLAVQRARAGAAGEAAPHPARRRLHAARRSICRSGSRAGPARRSQRRANVDLASERPSGGERAASGGPAAPAESVELPALVVALRASGGNVARAAAMLGISRQRAYRLMEGQAVDLEALRKPEDRRESGRDPGRGPESAGSE